MHYVERIFIYIHLDLNNEKFNLKGIVDNMVLTSLIWKSEMIWVNVQRHKNYKSTATDSFGSISHYSM